LTEGERIVAKNMRLRVQRQELRHLVRELCDRLELKASNRDLELIEKARGQLG